jgi:hypothetical protein
MVFVPARHPPSYISWRNRFLGSLNVYKFWLCCPGEKVVEKKKEADN